MVAAFIALLNVALTMAGLGQATVERAGGVTKGTAGEVKGLDATLSGSLHPAITTASINAGIQTLPTSNLRISFPCSPGEKAAQTASHHR